MKHATLKLLTAPCLLALGLHSIPAAAAKPDLLTRQFSHDQRCPGDTEPFSLRSQTIYERGFHSGDIDIEGGVVKFSLWGEGMDYATVSVGGSGTSLREIDTRSGYHNYDHGCPAEYGTLTMELSTPKYPAGTLSTNLVIRRKDKGDWTIPISVRAKPLAATVGWITPQASGGGGSSSTTPLTFTKPDRCSGQQGCGGGGGTQIVQAPGTGSQAFNPGTSDPDLVFANNLDDCLRGFRGTATVSGNTLRIRFPRAEQPFCPKTVRGYWKAQEDNDIELSDSSLPDVVQTSVIRSTPRTEPYFIGQRSEQQRSAGRDAELDVEFNWQAINRRFNGANPSTVTQPTFQGAASSQASGGARAAIQSREAGPAAPAPQPETIIAEIGVSVNGRSQGQLRIEIEAIP
ncbi:MAG TPA: hypothetical protein VGE47_12645 [Burkholderiaceae bacterium]